MALLLGATFPEVCGVAAFAPGHLSWSVFSTERRDGKPLPSWTLQGRPVPFAVMDAGLFEEHLAAAGGDDAVCLVPWFERCLQAAPAEAAIEVEKINGAILLISGADDCLWPANASAGAIENRLRSRGFGHAITNLVFQGAGHCFDLPTGSFPEDDRFFWMNGRRFRFGGAGRETLVAQREGWASLRRFLAAIAS